MESRTARWIAAAALCALFSAALAPALALTSSEVKAQQTQLERQLKDLEGQIAGYERQLKTIGAQKNTLANKIAELNAKQAQLGLKIKESTLQIADTESRIAETEAQMEIQSARLDDLHAAMASDLQALFKQDRRSTVEILLAEGGLSGFFTEVASYERLGDGLASAVGEVDKVNAALEERRRQLADQRQLQVNLAAIVGLQKEELDATLDDENALLRKTKGQEANYQQALKGSKQQVAELKNRIYKLIAVGKQVTFGEAVQVAEWASSQTGVRAAFLLAILTQESNLGANVGTCNRKGDPPSKSWKVIMKPERDQEPFKKITAELGLPIDTTPVSCPMRDKAGNQIGWGGAMGPAQFIPSTWMGYRSKIAAITGKTADPWDMRDAFLASALLLRANGGGSVSGEWAAAMRYFSGGTDTRYRFYGDNVVKLATQYQQDIDELEAN